MSISQMAGKNSLYIIGYGVNFVADRSVIADKYIKDAEIVFAVETDVHHLESDIAGRPLVNLIHLYKPGTPRSTAYSQIAEVVLDAFQRFRRVALLVEGSPFFLDSICEILEARAVALGIEVAIVDGRSSLDVLIQTLAVPIEFGIGVYTVSDLGEIRFDVEYGDNKGDRVIYRYEGAIRDDRVVFIGKPVSGKQPCFVEVWPHLGNSAAAYHIGICWNQSWDMNETLIPCLLSRKPLCDGELNGEHLAELWRTAAHSANIHVLPGILDATAI